MLLAHCSLNLLHIGSWLGALSTSLSRALVSPTSSISYINLCKLPLKLTGMQHWGSCAILKAHRVKVFFYVQAVIYIYPVGVTLIGPLAPLTCRSFTGWFVFLGHSPITWKTKKQHIVSRSSTEAEYRFMASITCEPKWLKPEGSSLEFRCKSPEGHTSLLW